MERLFYAEHYDPPLFLNLRLQFFPRIGVANSSLFKCGRMSNGRYIDNVCITNCRNQSSTAREKGTGFNAISLTLVFIVLPIFI